MNWAQVTEKKATGPSLRKYNLFLYLCLYFYVLFSYVEFLIQILLIVRCMQSGIETRGNLSTEFG